MASGGLLAASPAPAATCGENGLGAESGQVCGKDFSAQPNQTFSGSVATYSITSGAHYSSSTINWGDGTPQTAGTKSGSDTSGDVTGTHKYTKVGDYTVVVTISGCSNISPSFCLTASSNGTAHVGRYSGLQLACVPVTVPLGNDVTCTASVSDTDPDTAGAGTPTGSVAFTKDGPGTLAASSCTLAAGSCQVTYTPTAIGSEPHIVHASYVDGSNTHQSSADSAAFVVTKRATRTRISCKPGAIVVKTRTTCTATVHDIDRGARSRPKGKVTFGSDGAGSFGPPRSCTLPATGANSCRVSYRATSVGVGRYRLVATYGGDGTHASSTGNSTVGVGRTFSFGRLTLDTVNGTAQLVVKLRDPGRLVLSGKDVKRVSRSVAAGNASLTIEATGAARKQLLSKRSVTLKVAVTFTPAVGIRITKTKTVTLRLQ